MIKQMNKIFRRVSKALGIIRLAAIPNLLSNSTL